MLLARLGQAKDVCQQVSSRGWPLVAVLAGLPGLRGPRRMVTYLERGAWHDVGLLSPEDSREALVSPASAAGRPMDDDAAQRDLASGLYSARWHDSSPREKEYLAALAGLVRDGQRPTGSDVARVMGQQPQAVTYLRARLLAKGTVFTEGRTMRFAVPGTASWIGDQDAG